MKYIFFSLFFYYSVSLIGQDVENFPPPETPIELWASFTEEDIKIDGKLDEESWKHAPIVNDFFRTEPRQGGAYEFKTIVKLIYNKKKLFVGVYCHDSLGKKGVRVQDLRRDFRWGENDIFSIQLDPQNLKQYCVSFQTTPYGNQRDLQNFNGSYLDHDWNALWSVRTTQTDSGYCAEFAIPFKSLRYERPDDNDSVTWGITFARLARRSYEQTVFPAIPQSLNHYRMTYAAHLKGLKLPDPGANIRLEPYFLGQFDRSNGSSREKLKMGGDMKWAITPESVLDFTINTDFAQADVDRAVNNLERFNIFFPERRQFFLENSGIWAGVGDEAIVPFFSRAIGLQGDFNAEPARIDAGMRYTLRNERRSIAGLYIHQAENVNSPAASFAVGRYLQNYGKENNVGVMLTHRLDEGRRDGSSQSHNSTLTIDGLIRPRSEFTISYLLSGSRDNTPDSLGLAGRLLVEYRANKFYASWQSNLVSENYNPDMGYVFQKNVLWHNTGGYFIWRPKKISWIRRYDPGFFINYYQDAENLRTFQQGNLYIFPVYVILTGGSFFEYAINPTWQHINFRFAPLGILIEQGDYQYTRHQLNFHSDRSRKFSVSSGLGLGSFYDGELLKVESGLRYAPIPHIAFTLDYEFNDIQNLGSANEAIETHLTTFGGRFALNPRLQLSMFYQYNSFNDQGRWNVRGSWEYRPLSFIYVVYNNTQTNDFDRLNVNQQLIAKITFLKQF